MKKWLTACLLAIVLLFAATSAMADHRKANGDNCIGDTFQIRNTTETQHTLLCTFCWEEFTEDHWAKSGDEATCVKQAWCNSCYSLFGKADGPHDWGEWKPRGYASHIRTCNRRGTHTETEECTFSVAPCTESAACTKCGKSYMLGHDWDRWKSNGDKTHTRTCARDSSHIEKGNCTDLWEADCTSPAMCKVCFGEYGEADLSKHTWGIWESNGNGTHTRICYNEKSHTETEDCSGVSCGETGYCNDCWEEYTASHKLDDSWSSTPDEHGKVCIHCKELQSKALHSFVEQPDEKHLKSEATCVSVAVYYKACSECDYQLLDTFESGTIDSDNHDLDYHDAKAPTCTGFGWIAYETCKREGCVYTSYQKLDALDHDWEWVSNGNGTHTRTCKNDPSHTETETCSGLGCGETGACSVCKGEYTAADHKYEPWSHDADKHWRSCIYCNTEQIASHSFAEHIYSEATCASPAEYYKICSDCAYQIGPYDSGDIDPNNHDLIHHEAKAAACTEIGWKAYDTCSRCEYSTYEELAALGHDLIRHDGKAATCAEIGWKAYDTCSRCDHSTYEELAALGHDLIHHAAQAPTCTEIGWKAYDTCSRCDHSTYEELAALGHDPIHHAAQAPTCTEIGWKAYDTCSRCDYSTYAELAALGHNCQDEVFSRTCAKDGYTLHTCSRCGYSYRDAILPRRGHWYGEWTANGADTHTAACRRSSCRHEKTVACEIIELPSLNVSLCPVCGRVSDGTRLMLTPAVVEILTGRIPDGESVLRMGELADGEKLLTLGYVYGGRLSEASCQVSLILPAELVEGYTLFMLNADGTETAIDCTPEGDSVVLTLTFAQPLPTLSQPVLAVRLASAM